MLAFGQAICLYVCMLLKCTADIVAFDCYAPDSYKRTGGKDKDITTTLA